MKCFSFFTILLLSSMLCVAQPGNIDSTFGSNGVAKNFIHYSFDFLSSLEVQTDDKILASGYTQYDSIAHKYGMVCVRYHANGIIDSSFAVNGKAIITLNNGSGLGYAIKLLPNGKIILAGSSKISGNIGFACVRLNSDGSIDSTFGNAGVVITPIGLSDDRALTIHVHNDGRFLLAGYSKLGSYLRAVMIRYLYDGSIDMSFGNNGMVMETLISSNILFRGIVSDSIGNYIVGGYHTPITYTYAMLKKYSSLGAVDSSFGASGTFTTSVGNILNETCTKIIQQPDAKLLVGVTSDYAATKKFGVLRYHPSSTISDASFGNGSSGTSFVNTGTMRYTASSLALQQDGKILVSGNYNNVSTYSFALLRYNANGTVDSTFGTNGIVTTSILPTNDNSKASDVVTQSTGAIVVGGITTSNNISRFTLVRYHASDITVNVKNVSSKLSTMVVYTNLSNAMITIQGDTHQNIIIQNALGEVVYSKSNGDSSESIDVSGLAEGVYFVRINEQTMKFVKE
jgi:uncharacterized delta-60 repeat protein